MSLGKDVRRLIFRRGTTTIISDEMADTGITKYEAEPRWDTTLKLLTVYDGTQNMPVVNHVPTTRVTTTYQILVTDHDVFCNTDGGAFTATFPVGVNGQTLRIINCGSSGNDLTLGGTFRGVASQTVSDGEIVIATYETTEGWW